MSRKPKAILSQDFSGKDSLELVDVQDWVVPGWGEAAKASLDDMEWDGEAVVSVGITLSPDNKKIIQGKVFLQGELLKSSKEIRVNKLWDQSDKDLRLSYRIDDASIFTFNDGSLVGDYVDSSNINWMIVEKGNSTALEVGDYTERGVEEFCIRPFIIPLSAEKAKLKVLIFPVSKDRLSTDFAHFDKPSFPGLEMFSMELPLFPLTRQAGGKDWGCPLIPMILLGADGEDEPNLPPTQEIRRAISAIMRTAKMPDVKRDSKTVLKAWGDIRESGPSKLKERLPDLLWPEVAECSDQPGETSCISIRRYYRESLT